MSIGNFSQTYAEARGKFLAAADAAGLDSHAHVHPLLGRDGETLALDVVRDGPADAQAVLLISSACHGVEGYCGSGVQVALLGDAALRQAAHANGVALLFLHGLNPEARVLINDGGAAFQPMRIVPLPSLGTQLLAADVDRDGKPDLLVLHADLMQVTYLRGQGDGTFAAFKALAVEKQPVALAVADADGDAVLDLLSLSSDGVLSVLRGGGDGTFSAAFSVVASEGPRALTTGDWNCDGKLDVAVVGMTAKNNLRILLNRGR